MYAFIVDLNHLRHTGHAQYFLIFFVLVWLRWIIVNITALFYRPYRQAFTATTSVIIPVVDEDTKVFDYVLRSILVQHPSEIIVVINGPKNEQLERLCARYKQIRCTWTPIPGKRNALKVGLGLAQGDIALLVDSDTVWGKNLLTELLKPFSDPKVGGVTPCQRIIRPTASLLNRFCAWLEEVRTYGTMRAMSVTGKVGCLPGRTIAFRRSILNDVLDEFMHERFLGFHKEVSDDRSLTNLTLRKGYKTVLQNTAVVYTEAPETWKKFFRQQLRWAEGSQYNNVKMSAWMLRHAPLMFFLYTSDTLIPFLLYGMYGTFLLTKLLGSTDKVTLVGTHELAIVVLLSIIGACLSYAMRQVPVLRKNIHHLAFIPLYILLLSFIMAPIRMVGFAKLADDLGWGTRRSAYQPSKEPS